MSNKRWFERSPLDQAAVRDVDERIAALEGLPPNWDSYEALPIEHRLIERVRTFLMSLVAGGVPLPGVVPTSAGAVVLEWHLGQRFLKIELDPDRDDLVTLEWDEVALDHEGDVERLPANVREKVQVALFELT